MMARQNFAHRVAEKLASAKRLNEQVYHDSIPHVQTLELLAGMSLIHIHCTRKYIHM